MDKRTVFFVISLSITLFFVNLFFQYLNRDEMKKWTEQQQTKARQQQEILEQEIKEHSIPLSELSLVELFADNEAEEFLTTAVETNGAILALSWSPQQPKFVYFRKKGTIDPLKKLEIAVQPELLNQPTLYLVNDQEKLQLGNLPSFGLYDLQLFVPSPTPFTTLGQYTDGNIEIPLQKLQKGKPLAKAIALIRSDQGYLPVGYYDGKRLLLLSNSEQLSPFVSLPKIAKKAPTGKRAEEQYYVLEDAYQQLVFSNYGGALAEINLPFRTEHNQESVVKPVQFDRDMVEHHPYNAYFPAHPYYTPGDPEEHQQGKLGGFTPLIRRDLIETAPYQSVKIAPGYYALNIVSDYPEVAQLVYEVKAFEKNKIVFEAEQNHRRITKTFTLAEDAPYTLDVAIKVEGDSRGLWLSSGVPEVDLISGAPAPTLKLRTSSAKKAKVDELKLPKDTLTVTTTKPDWITTSNGFFALILDPLTQIDPGYRLQNVSGTEAPSRLVEIGQEYEQYKAQNFPGYMAMLPFKATNGVVKFRIYAGPLSERILKQVDAVYTDPATGYNPDYIGVQSFHGWFAFISEPFAKFLNILMVFFHQITGSWGFSIILLTVVLRLMLYPLNAWSTRSMLKMQEVAPKAAALQEKYKNDPKKLQLETMNLYRESGANPISGCFPIFIQLPFLLGMFGLLKTSFALRGASFIPGWIDDLSAPDVLFSWQTPIFFFGNSFHLLPLLLGAVMFLQQRLMSTAPKDVSQMTEQQRQSRAMGNMMAIVFTVLFYHFPSGLNIYWLSSMLLGMLQQWWMQRQMKGSGGDKDLELKVKKVK